MKTCRKEFKVRTATHTKMEIRYVLTDYVGQALAHAIYDKLDDGTFAGRIPECKGVVAFGATRYSGRLDFSWAQVGASSTRDREN